MGLGFLRTRRAARHGASAVLEPPAPAPERQDTPARGPQPAESREAAPGLTRAGIFWSAQGHPGATDPFFGSGKYVAAAEWTKALARYGSMPNVDIYAPITGMDRCHQQLRGLPSDAYGAAGARTRLLAESDLPGQLRAHAYDVLHEPTGIDLTRASYARARFSDRVFPITCSQMGISYSFDLHATFIKLLTAQIYPCDAIICPTHSARYALEKKLTDIAEKYSSVWNSPPPLLPRLEVIPWGVDTERFTPRDSGQARRELDLPPDRPIVLCLGRIRIQDKMDLSPLLLAFDRVCKEVQPRPLLVLAGGADPEYVDHLLSHAAHLGLHHDIRTFFDVPAACLPSLYAACDVFVSPVDSCSETFGLTIIEAMACSRPVVASDWNGYKELIVHGETGFKVTTYWADCLDELNEIAPILSWDQQHLHLGQSVCVDVGEMAAYLTQVLTDGDLREEMGWRGRARVAALYDRQAVIGQWEALWTELAAIAHSSVQKQVDRLDYLRPGYFAHFSHHASEIIDDDTPVTLTERGRECLSGQDILFPHPWTRGSFLPHQLPQLLNALKPADWLGAILPTGKLVEALRKRHGLSRDKALMYLMWLAKHDVVTRCGLR